MQQVRIFFCVSIFIAVTACSNSENKPPSPELISALNLKRGEVISCSPRLQLGSVNFVSSCSEKVQKDFDLAVALLHSFEYDEAEKVFAKIIDEEPGDAIAYWGIAMSNFHPLWTPPTQAELEKGSKAVSIAQSLTKKTNREAAYIDAIALFYKDYTTTDHLTRCNDFEKAMEKIYKDYPDDKEAAIFYALALDGAADPTDKTFAKQKKAGDILMALYKNNPDHPGIIHYIIHSYDYPELANLALEAARKYAAVAPSSAHAQHMPSHIFTRLGLWDECIASNLQSTASAKCYADSTGIKGHWDEELHGMDYLVYAYLQKGDNAKAKEQLDYLETITTVNPANFKVAYAFAAIPSRYLLENRMWKEAAGLEVQPANFSWEKFPWQNAIVHFTKALGLAHTGQTKLARNEWHKLNIIHDTLMNQKDTYKANQVAIQMKSAEAWILLYEGKQADAIAAMTVAADMEDKTQKHPVTPGEVLPARELLADMLLSMKKYKEALTEYEADLKTHPNRLNGLKGKEAAIVALK